MNIQEVLPRDSIPSIDKPTFSREYFGNPDDEVIVVDADPPRAYPIRILSYHEIVNDVLNGRSIAVTWCPICWSAVVYERTVDGQTLTFGVSGKLADDALVMYDHETESEWKQPTGTAIAGELKGTQLTVLPAALTTWERFVADHPNGEVLEPVRGTDEASGGPSLRNAYDMAPYERYVANDAFGLYGMRGEGEPRSWNRDDIAAKTVVLGVEHSDEAMGYSIPEVDATGGVITDTVGGLDIVVFLSDGEIHAFENPGFEFEPHDESFYADGTSWDSITGESADGRTLEQLPTRRLFAFAWQDAHGPDAFY